MTSSPSGFTSGRGEMTLQESLAKGYRAAPAEYIQRAIERVETNLTSGIRLMYIVASDDIAWSKRNIRSSRFPVEFASNGSRYLSDSVDLAILASCNRSIITVGTFGWWAGYLAAGPVVYYKDFPVPGSELADHFKADDYFHPTWIGLA